MDDIRKKDAKRKKIKYLNFITFLKKNKIKIILLLFFLSILIFPQNIGQFIGQWVTDFIGNIIKYIKL